MFDGIVTRRSIPRGGGGGTARNDLFTSVFDGIVTRRSVPREWVQQYLYWHQPEYWSHDAATDACRRFRGKHARCAKYGSHSTTTATAAATTTTTTTTAAAATADG